MAKNEDYQRNMGNQLAQNTDNKFLQSMARNETVQRTMGNVVSKTAENKEMQKKIGNKIAEKAQDKETQKKVAQGFVTVGKGLWSVSKKVGAFAVTQGKQA